MARLSQADVETLGLDDDDLEVLEVTDLPDPPEVELTGEEEDHLGHAEEARAADLERVALLSDDAVRYLSEPSPDPMTDGLEHDDGTDLRLARSRDEPQPAGLLEVATLDDLRLLEEIGVRAAVTGGVRIPGFVWRPFTKRSVSTSALIGPRAIIRHTMGVGTMNGSWSYHNAPGMPYTHGYYDGIGNRIQAQGADRRAAGTLEGNPYVIAHESEDYGQWFPNAGRTCGSIPPWRPEQLRVFAVDDAWTCKRFGIPAALMPDSCAGTRGIGYHRLGIYPWRKAGCLYYSRSNYKCCPDVARIAQMPGHVRSVAAILGGVPTPPPASWPPPFPGTVRLTTPMMQGAIPFAWQRGLRLWAKYSDLTVDGFWGPASNHVLVMFQRRVGITPDGIGGPITWGHLARLAPKPTTPTPGPAPTPTPKRGNMLFLVQATTGPRYVTDWLHKRAVTDEDINVILWITTKGGQPLSMDGGKPHALSAEQADVLARVPVA